MVATLQQQAVEVIALAVDDHHFHILARFPKPTDRDPWAWRVPMRNDENRELAIARHFVGIAKKESALALSDANLMPNGGVWAKRCRVLSIRDRAHQLNVYNYIKKHASRGAAIWVFSDTSNSKRDR